MNYLSKYRNYFFLLTVLIITVFYWDVLRSMILEIFGNYLSYSHNLLAPIISLFIILSKREEIGKVKKEFSLWGLLVVFLSALLTAFAIIFGKYATLTVSYFINIIGIVILFYGLSLFKLIFFPLFILLLIVPIPYHYIRYVIEPATRYDRLISTQISTLILKLLGIKAFSTDFTISIPLYKFKVGMYCSGLNYVISLLLVSLIFLYLTQGSFKRKTIFLITIIPISIVSNILRIVFNILFAHYIGPTAADIFFHFFSGLFFSIVAFILFFVSGRIIGLRFKVKKREIVQTDEEDDSDISKPIDFSHGKQVDDSKRLKKSSRGLESGESPDKVFFTVEDVSKILNLSIKSVQNRIETGRIKCFRRDGKIVFSKKDIDDYLKVKWWEQNWWKIAFAIIGIVCFVSVLIYLLYFIKTSMWGSKYVEIAEKNIRDRDFFSAAINLKEALRLKPKDNELRMKLARVLAALGDEQQMLTNLLEVLRTDPENIDALETLAFYYYKNGNLEYAERECKKILALMKNHFFANNLLGLIKASQSEFQDAVEYFEKVLEINPDFSPARKNIADIYSLQMHYLKSIKEYDKSDLKDLTTKLNKAITYEKAGEDRRAIEIYNNILELAPIISRAYNNLAWITLSKTNASLQYGGDFDSLNTAFDFARRALLLNPEDGTTHDTVGWIFFLMGRYRESEKYLTYASELLPENPLILIHQAMLYDKRGKKELAIEKLKKAEKLSVKAKPYLQKSVKILIENLRKSLAAEIKAAEEKAKKRREKLEKEKKRQEKSEKKVKEKEKKTKKQKRK